MVGKKAILLLVLISLGLVAATFHPAQSVKRATIDFSGFAEGAIVRSLSHGAGISGDPIDGSVSVFGFNPAFPGTNTAMIFDATCAGGCSGGDDDLYFPEPGMGNGLIISEDLDKNDPDDADNPGVEFWFDFSKFGTRKVDLDRLTVADVDEREFGEIHVYRGGRNGTLVKTVSFSPTANNDKKVVSIDVKDIDYMVVDLNGSGMIDNIEIEIKEPNNGRKISLNLNGTCYPEKPNEYNMKFWGTLKRDGEPIANHEVTLSLPNNGEKESLKTGDNGYYEYIFEGARIYIGQDVTASATVDGVDYTKEHEITGEEEGGDFEKCPFKLSAQMLTIEVICELQGQLSHDLRLTGMLTDSDQSPVPNHTIELDLPDREELVFVTTDPAGNYSYLFVGAYQYLGTRVLAETTLEGERVYGKEEGVDGDGHPITAADFEDCQDKPKQYECHKVKLFTFHRQPIEIGSQIPGWGLVDTRIECRGIGQGKSCRLVVKGQPGYVVKSDSLEMVVPRLEPYVQYQAQIKGYDGAWTKKGCEFSFITGGRAASISTHLADQVDQLGWVSLGERQNAIKPLGVCSGWSDACLFAENIIGFHLDDIYGNQQPGSQLAALQPGDQISIYRDHRLYTYEFTGSERVRQSAEGNQAILDAAEQHDLVLTTCSGYWLFDEGHFSHTRLATFALLPRIERLHRWE